MDVEKIVSEIILFGLGIVVSTGTILIARWIKEVFQEDAEIEEISAE